MLKYLYNNKNHLNYVEIFTYLNYSSYLCDMKSTKVLKILHVYRQTLVQYVKKKDIRVVKLPNGTYDYNDDDVYRKAGLAAERMNVIYSRVSTAKQKTDLDNQEKTLIDYCNKNGVKVSKSYKDIASGMNFDRK